ncbi:hypothetical protein EV652_103689 [Kribbella steppae]|uniref:Uncharacterized protein n=1 Tax=Kribbella steppae TaxID=2512223 RepID=A0A4R2HRG9_9ACTN|nr:hypothetical protein EV652_103689 [Kribbella steppae]
MRLMLLGLLLLVLLAIGYYGLEDIRRYLRIRDM